MLVEQFAVQLADRGIVLSEQQLQQFDTYYHELVTWNTQMNLTAITDQSEVYTKHFFDSLSVILQRPELRDQTLRVCDVGSGAGFPSVPLKIVCPHWHVTIVDSLQKRIKFLTHLCDALGLSDVQCVHDRAESFGQQAQYREQFDLVTARAVARLPLLSEFCLPLVRVGGQFIAMKAGDVDEELASASNALQLLGGRVTSVVDFTLPEDAGSRTLVMIEKHRATPKKYPRKAGVPAKQPLV